MSQDVTKNYKNLATAIIKQAIRDYEYGRNLQKKEKIGSEKWIIGQWLVDDVKRFFHSQWFIELSNSDGPSMFKKIEENYNKYGKCILFKEEIGE